MNQIKNIWDEKVICEGEESIKELAEKNKADLRGADLWGADLRGANLRGADLREANLRGAKNFEFSQFPSIRLISSIRLNDLPDNLQLELMRRDASGHPHPEKFDAWAAGGDCPYGDVERFWLFEPIRKLWSPGVPQMADRDLVIEICRSQGWQIKGYIK